MGKSEMECPAELWVSEESGPGHPNEEVLSMLQSVRTYFHKLIYRKSPLFADLTEFLSEFLHFLSPIEDSLYSQIDECNDLYLPLVELLSSAESAAPDRLLRLYVPNRKAIWRVRCCSEAGEGSGGDVQLPFVQTRSMYELSLDYLIPGKSETVQKTLNLSEIEDFQSSVVLAQTDKRGEETTKKVQNFIKSFGWMKILHSALEDLKGFLFFCC